MLHTTGRNDLDQGLTNRQLSDHHAGPPDLERAVRIRTGESDNEAVTPVGG